MDWAKLVLILALLALLAFVVWTDRRHPCLEWETRAEMKAGGRARPICIRRAR